MTRWHAIQSNVNESLTLSNLSHFAERLYWRMLATSDQWGRGPGAVRKIRARCIALVEGVSDHEIVSALEELGACRRVSLYEHEGDWYYWIVDFDKHQPRELKRKRGPSRFPESPGQMPLLPYASSAVSEGADPSFPGSRRRTPEEAVPEAEADEEIEIDPAEQLRTVASGPGRAALLDQQIEESTVPPVDLGSLGASIECRLDDRSASECSIAPLLDVLPDADSGTQAVLSALLRGRKSWIDMVRDEVLSSAPRRPAAYAVRIAQRLAGEKGAA